MITDGHWGRELRKLRTDISIWRNFTFPNQYIDHRLNRDILYSAAILRKILEDEKEAKSIAEKNTWPLPDLITTHITLSAICFPHIADDKWTVRGKITPSDYDPGDNVELSLREICNEVMHSYVWSLVQNQGRSKYLGFLVASDHDKEKLVYYISFDEWQNLLNSVINHIP